jgi:hypothetical protein
MKELKQLLAKERRFQDGGIVNTIQRSNYRGNYRIQRKYLTISFLSFRIFIPSKKEVRVSKNIFTPPGHIKKKQGGG